MNDARAMSAVGVDAGTMAGLRQEPSWRSFR